MAATMKPKHAHVHTQHRMRPKGRSEKRSCKKNAEVDPRHCENLRDELWMKMINIFSKSCRCTSRKMERTGIWTIYIKPLC